MVSSHLSAKGLTPPKVFALGGPTASGKTALAVQLVQLGLPLELVNFDASQLYRGLDAATAKPTAAERAAAPFHLLDLLDPQQPAAAGQWAEWALACLADIHSRGRWPLLVGGTGLYLRALRRGLAPIPAVDPQVRAQILAELAERGPGALHQELALVDPVYAAATPAANRQRVARALEVYRATGRAFSQWHAEHRAQPDRVDCALAVLTPTKEWLQPRIASRATAMVEPLLAEVAQLLAAGVPLEAPGLQALGYRNAARVVQGQLPAAQLGELLIAEHQSYAKRQITWFAAEPAHLRPDPAQLSADPGGGYEGAQEGRQGNGNSGNIHSLEQLARSVQAWFGGPKSSGGSRR